MDKKTALQNIKDLNLKYMLSNQKNLGDVVKSLDLLLSIAKEIETVADKLQASGFKDASTALQALVKQVTDLPKQLQATQLEADKTPEVIQALTEVRGAIQRQKLDPRIEVKSPIVNVPAPDLSKLIAPLQALTEKIKPTTVDTESIVEAVKAVKKTIASLSFPAPNFILPFKNSAGAATQVQLDSNGKVPTSATIDTTGLSTSAKQDTQQTALDAIKTAVETLDNIVSGSEAQVDIVGSLPAGTNNIGDVDIASIAAGTNAIGKLTQPATPALTNVTMDGTSVTLKDSNTARRNLMIFNDSGVVVYVKLGTTASSTSFTVKMVDQSYYELPDPVYTGVVTALGASGSVRVTEVV